MGSPKDFQEDKARHKNTLRNWILKGKPMPSGRERPDVIAAKSQDSIIYYKKKENREVDIFSRKTMLSHIAAASSELAERSGEVALEMSKTQAENCLFTIESKMEIDGCDLLFDEPITPIGFKDDDGYCFLRLPIPRVEPTQDWLEYDLDYAALGPFLDSLRINMTDFDGTSSLMFKRLLSAVGALLWDSEPRREIIYWQGQGGEGKTTFCNFLAHKLGRTAMPNVKPKSLTEDYNIAALEGIRLVIAEEVGKGRFLTDELKAITGNRFLKGRDLYKSPRAFRNHSFVWMTSNERPIIKAETSHTDRLRWINSAPRKDGIKRTEKDIFEELEDNWMLIVSVAIREYFLAGKTIWPLTDSEIAVLSDSYYLGIDGWIEENLKYSPGSFVPDKLIQRILSLRNEKISYAEVKERLCILQPDVCSAEALINIDSRARINGKNSRGIKNIGLNISKWANYSDEWRLGLAHE